MRLLVVDDEASVREALALVLDLSGFEVATASDGREAIRALVTAAPDAVILDVLMPVWTGWRCAGGCAQAAITPRC